LIILFLSLSFVSVIFAYLAAVILSTIGLAIYSYRILPRLINNISFKTDPLLTKELLLFSLPLLGITVLSILTLYADTILLGFFKSPAEVGLYNAAYPLANFITVPYTAFLLIYTPVASKLFSRNKLDEMRRNHIISAKWITSITIPLFLLLLLYPDILIGSLFGGAYISSAPILRILAIGFMINIALGPNVGDMLALGKASIIIWAVLVSTVLNISLSVILIPPLAITGAAISSATSMIVSNFLVAAKIYSLNRAHPFCFNLVKPLLATLLVVMLIQFAVSNLLTITIWMLPLIMILFYLIYGAATIITRSLDHEDVALVMGMASYTNIDKQTLEKILDRIIRAK